VKATIYILFFFALAACQQNKNVKDDDGNSIETNPDFRKLSATEKEAYKATVARMYDSILGRRNFNGGVLVAKNGEILFEDYKGYANLDSKDTITQNSAFHIASVSKTFTGVAVLKLWEEKKINLDDSVQTYLAGFPYSGITVRMLLNHRSGLPNYVYFMPADTAWKRRGRIATNNDVLEFMISRKPGIQAYPNRRFQYCNTNYALLALIVEKVTGQYFPEYMKSTIFTPLAMENTFIFSIKDTANYTPSYNYNNTIFPLENMDCIYGDKNVYSTPRDLLKWDQALYTNNIIKQSTFEEATQPTSNERPSIHNYGLGFRLMLMPNDYKIVYHNGWWHGNNAVFSRLIKDTATIIIVGNKYNREIYKGFKMGLAFSDALDPNKQEDDRGGPSMKSTK
jgi:CubicO group peptidase (beta-lactamase class C family)